GDADVLQGLGTQPDRAVDRVVGTDVGVGDLTGHRAGGAESEGNDQGGLAEGLHGVAPWEWGRFRWRRCLCDPSAPWVAGLANPVQGNLAVEDVPFPTMLGRIEGKELDLWLTKRTV